MPKRSHLVLKRAEGPRPFRTPLCTWTGPNGTQVSPVAVSGSIELKLEFTTTDGLFHEESFYELSFSFICPTEGPYSYTYEETPTAAPTTVTPSSYSYTYKEAPTAAPTTETGSPTSL